MYSLNVAGFLVDPHNPQEYISRDPIMVDPDNHDNVIYLLLHGTHYQQIIISNGCYFMNDHHLLVHGHQESVSCTELHSTTEDHSRYLQLGSSISDNVINDLSLFPIHDKSTFLAQDILTSHTSYDINCPLSQDMISTADLLCSYIQEEMVEPLFNDALVSNSTFVEASDIPITNESAVVCE